MRNRRGESEAGEGAAIFILLMGIFIVAYIILVPEPEREFILGEGDTTLDDDTANVIETLLSESPGMVHDTEQKIQSQSLESMHLYTKEEEQSESLAATLTISRNLLVNNYKEIIFDIDDLGEVQSVELIFLIEESKGDLRISVNGKDFFDGELTSSDLPLEIPPSYLLEGENKVRLSAQFPSYLVTSNYYILQDVNLIRNLELTNVESSRTFYVEDVDTLQKAKLSYFVNCNKDEEGELTILLNNEEIFSDLVFCSYLEEREITLDDSLLTTRNVLRFIINKGDYNIDQVKVTLTNKEADYPTYFFEIDEDLYDEILSGAEIKLYFTFENAEDIKSGTVTIQDETFKLNTRAINYEKDITSWMDYGQNVIKIEPSNDFEIVNLKITVEN